MVPGVYGVKIRRGKVICGMDIKMKKRSICHVLSKRSLMTIDTFLFDVGKANTDDGVNYDLLEKKKMEEQLLLSLTARN